MKYFFILGVLCVLNFIAEAQGVGGYYQDKRFALSVNAGGALRTAKTDESLNANQREIIKKLRRGWNLGIDARYFVNTKWGVGLKYSHHQSAVTITADIGVGTPTSFNEVIHIRYIGPSYVVQLLTKNSQHIFLIDVGVGYLSYSDKLDGEQFIKGGTLGSAFGVEYEYVLSSRIGVGVQLGGAGGTLSKYKQQQPNGSYQEVELPDNKKESLSYINLSAGLRIRL